MTMNRRRFLGNAAAASLCVAAPAVIGAARPRVVVVGGGAGGATAARYIAKDSKGAIDVVLVEPTREYYTCVFSNLYLGGVRNFESLGHSYARLAGDFGINVVHDWAIGVDTNTRSVALAGGQALRYDKLVLSPGIDFVPGSIPGWDLAAQQRMPHAYKGGTQVALLKAQIEKMRPGGVFVVVAPPDPYRCPPGPYERVSMVAHLLKQKNPTAKIIVVDTKSAFSKQALFQDGWSRHYPGMIEWLPKEITGGIKGVNPDTMEVMLDAETVRADVVNAIPAQKAGRIAELAGLTNAQGWVPVDPHSMRSRMNEHVYVIGDAAQQGEMPKSAFAANSQAIVCANAVRGSLTGSPVQSARYFNTCWSLLAVNDGVKIGEFFEPTDEKIVAVDSFVSKVGEDASFRKATYEESLDWYDGLTQDAFGIP